MGATLPDTTARVLIGASDQPAQTTPVISVADAQAGEGDPYIDFVVSLSGPSTQAVSVAYGMSNATALSGSDYLAYTGTLVFEAGETLKTVRVPLNGDTVLEGVENFFFNLGSPNGASIGNNHAIGTLIDNDATAGTPVIRLGDAIVDEKDGRAYVTVTLDKPSTSPVSVSYGMVNGTAVSGADFQGQPTQVLSFAAGEVSKTIAVSLVDDVSVESTGEVFDVVFTGAVGATLSDTRAHVVIAPSDTAVVVTPTLTVSPPIAVEGSGVLDFVVSLNGPSAQAVSVNYGLSNATALSGSDYTAYTGTLVFESGETLKTVRVSLTGDSIAEPTETFSLNLGVPVGLTVASTPVVATILDDDPASAAGVNVIGTAGADVLRGLATADTLTGGAGNDVLDGGAGTDSLVGGTGDDLYLLEQTTDVINEAAAAGTDTVLSYLSTYTLGANLERLVLGSGAVTGVGNAGNNTIVGNTGANVLDGGAGADTIDGGAGVDWVTYVGSTAAVSASLTTNTATGGWAQGDTFLNIENLRGSAFADTLTGNASANVLEGQAGNDTLNGAAGTDTLTGGLGLDTFVFNNVAGVDSVTDFSSVNDTLRLSMAGIAIGNADTVVDGGLLRAAPGGFTTAAELVIFTTDIVGAITTASAAAQIGSATTAYAAGAKVLFAVDNGTQTGVFAFTSSGADAVVSAAELTQIALVTGDATALADYTFGP